VYVNNERVQTDEPPAADALLHGRWLLLRRGKRALGVVEVRHSE
jgi:tyrosyl-tRNA synthetase